MYIKDENIHFYNEKSSHSSIGGVAYELGRPLLEFLCYPPQRFEEGFSITALAFDHELAHVGAMDPDFIQTMKESMGRIQQGEVYLYFYAQVLMDFAYAFIASPKKAVEEFAEQFPGADKTLAWAAGFAWPRASCPDKEKHLYRAMMDACALLSADLVAKQAAMTAEIELLLSFRAVMHPPKSSMEYLYYLEQYRLEKTGQLFYLENPRRSFYAAFPPCEVVQLYEIDSIDDLFRFEFVKMIEKDIFIKKCANCGLFFIPRRRSDVAYCDRMVEGGQRKCSEIGAMLRYEKKVAENPILEAYSKAYKRYNSRTRTKKMTQTEFLNWSDQARKRRDQCLVGELPFGEFCAWLEQDRMRKSRR